MLAIFPEILFLAPLSALLIRSALAACLAYAAWRHAPQPNTAIRVLAGLEIATAGAIAAGAWTQLAAIAAFLLFAAAVLIPRLRTAQLSTVLLSLVLALSILVTGPGALAIDLPL